MKRTYSQFPQKPDFEQKYNFKANLPYIVGVIAGMDGQFGEFITDAPDIKRTPIIAKRAINIEISEKRTEFISLNKDNLSNVLKDIDNEGTIDFRIILRYTYLDEKYVRVPFKGDSFLVRTILDNGVLTIKVHRVDGLERTESGRIADTIVDEIVKNAPNV
ncbi:MAG: hypothetical protein J5U17_10550 [Candidatus Methanoperedens sp.]|nr:hypothetical protein [Candidatus Methanoperedens sp.]MCE8426202.1 hypothetical protein [Candidatus Methanoperedens sp.]MCE8428465.1 hypothetical protein [Candidatus Methanoperedens sp.]